MISPLIYYRSIGSTKDAKGRLERETAVWIIDSNSRIEDCVKPTGHHRDYIEKSLYILIDITLRRVIVFFFINH